MTTRFECDACGRNLCLFRLDEQVNSLVTFYDRMQGFRIEACSHACAVESFSRQLGKTIKTFQEKETTLQKLAKKARRK